MATKKSARKTPTLAGAAPLRPTAARTSRTSRTFGTAGTSRTSTAAGRRKAAPVAPAPARTGRVRTAVANLDALDRLAEIFASLGSAPRLRLLYLLHFRPELNVGELAELTGLTVSGVSMHLRRLRGADLVCCRRDGQTVCCALPDEGDHVRFLGQLFRQIASDTGCC